MNTLIDPKREPICSTGDPVPPIAEFHCDGKTLCIDPISGQWAAGYRDALKDIHQQLLEARVEWQRNPIPDDIIAPPTTMLIIFKNKHCNLCCTYCYAESSPEARGGFAAKEDMSVFIRWIQELYPERTCSVIFHGGEPMMDWRVIESVVRQHRKDRPSSDRTSFSIVTNGTLITSAVADTIKELDISVCVSVDGPKHVHNKARIYADGRGSFDEGMRGYQLLRERDVPLSSIGTVIDPADLGASYEFYRDLGVQNIFLRPLRWQGRAIALLEQIVGGEGEQAYYRRFAIGLMDVAEAVAEHNRTHDDPVVEYGLAVRLFQLIRSERPFLCLRSPCGAAGHKLCLGNDGNVFPCDTMMAFPELSIGNMSMIHSAGDLRIALDKASVLKCLNKRRIENIKNCSRCSVQRFCGAECSAASYGKFGRLDREGDRCAFEQIVFVELLWKLVEDVRYAEWLCPGILEPSLFAWS